MSNTPVVVTECGQVGDLKNFINFKRKIFEPEPGFKHGPPDQNNSLEIYEM